MFRIVCQRSLIEWNAIDKITAPPNHAAARGISRNEQRLRLACDLQNGFDFRSRIAAQDGIDLFVDPCWVNAEYLLSDLGNTLGGGIRGQAARVRVDRNDIGIAGRLKLPVNFGGQAVSE